MTPRYRIEYSPRAYAEIAAIYAYIAQDSVDHAEGMVDRIVAAIDLLGTASHRQRVYDPKGRLGGEVFSLPVPPYMVFFRISEQIAMVRIARIRHGAQRPLKQV